MVRLVKRLPTRGLVPTPTHEPDTTTHCNETPQLQFLSDVHIFWSPHTSSANTPRRFVGQARTTYAFIRSFLICHRTTHHTTTGRVHPVCRVRGNASLRYEAFELCHRHCCLLLHILPVVDWEFRNRDCC